jgi:hypothetical protein
VARTTSAAVKDVLRLGSLGGDYDDANEPSLTPYITAANLIVTRVNTCATARGRTLSAAELAEIETWLAAHFYVQSDQTYASKSTGGASASFHGQTGMYLESSRYGQTAVSLDYSGCLSALGNRRTAAGYWLGRRPSEQTDYSERD